MISMKGSGTVEIPDPDIKRAFKKEK